MNCSNCGCEIKENENICSICGHNLEANASKSSANEKLSELPEKNGKKVFAAIFGNVLFILLLVIGVVAVLAGNDIINFQSDEKQLVGTWQMDTSQFGEGWDALSNLDGVITVITFMSDGTCIVDGTSSPENGEWSIVDDQLKVVGSMGGLFWNYDGFIVNYDLNDDVLEIYDDHHQYFYYKQ